MSFLISTEYRQDLLAGIGSTLTANAPSSYFQRDCLTYLLRQGDPNGVPVMPDMMTDQLLPLRIQPKPSALVRVLVGRHDVVTPERECDADELMGRLHQSKSEFERQALRHELEKQFGRFTWPVTAAAEVREAKRRQR